MTESRLALGRKPPTRLRCVDGEGRAVAASALRAHSPPSTAPILTSELPMAGLLAPSRLTAAGGDGGEGGEVGLWQGFRAIAPALCRLHRNEPGWFVGEHMHLLLRLPAAGEEVKTLTDGPGDRVVPASLTRVGEAERWEADRMDPLGRLTVVVAIRGQD